MIIGFAQLGEVAIGNSEREKTGGHHVHEVVVEQGVIFNGTDDDAASHLVVEVAQPGLMARAFDDGYLASHELGDVGDDTVAGGLHKHLCGLVSGTAPQHLRLEFGRLGNFDGGHVNVTALEHGDELAHVSGHYHFERDALVGGKIADALVVVAQRVALENEETGGAIEGAHPQRVGEWVLVTARETCARE